MSSYAFHHRGTPPRPSVPPGSESPLSLKGGRVAADCSEGGQRASPDKNVSRRSGTVVSRRSPASGGVRGDAGRLGSQSLVPPPASSPRRPPGHGGVGGRRFPKANIPRLAADEGGASGTGGLVGPLGRVPQPAFPLGEASVLEAGGVGTSGIHGSAAIFCTVAAGAAGPLGRDPNTNTSWLAAA